MKVVDFFLEKKSMLILLILVNIGGFFFGIYYYWYQLGMTPWPLWIFVIDCPLYAIMFAAILTLRFRKKTYNLLNFLTSIGLIKYGLWTGIVVVMNWEYFFSASPYIYAMLFPLHIGMILEGLILVPKTKIILFYLPLVTSWFLINDFFDYLVGTLPLIPPVYIDFLFVGSVTVSFLVPVGLFIAGKRTR